MVHCTFLPIDIQGKYPHFRRMHPSPYVLVGKITAPHGIRGHVKVQSYTEIPEEIFQFSFLYNVSGDVSYRLKKQGTLKGQFVVSLKESTDRNHAETLRNLLLYAKREEFKPLEQEDIFYISDLIGCAVYDTQGEMIGHVTDVHNFGAGDIVEIMPLQGASSMALFTDTNFPHVDLEKRFVTYTPPEMMG